MPQSIRPPPGAGAGASLFGGGADAPTEERHVNGNGNGASLFGGGGESPSPAPAAARRVGGRGGGGADLFGGIAQAGGEEDMPTAAVKSIGGGGAMSAVSAEEPKMTGQRNESSVLFSLSALTNDTKNGPPPPPKDRTTAQADGSGLIDIRALSANMSKGDSAGKNHVDDIMNLSGGGAFGAALAAPILAPPPMADIPGPNGESQNKGNKMLLIGLLGAGGFIAFAIIIAVVVLKGSSTQNGNASANNSAGPLPTMSVAQNDPSTATTANSGTAPTGMTSAATGTTPPSSADTSQAALPPGQNPKAASPITQPKSNSGSGSGVSPPAHTADPTPAVAAIPKPPAGGGDINSAIANAAGAPTPPPAAAQATSDQPFDRGAAAATLGGVNYQSCKKSDGPTGGGHIQITFGPNGSVQSANVDQPPFAGTPVGGCIAGKFRSAHVPAFAGSPVKVGKSFTIN